MPRGLYKRTPEIKEKYRQSHLGKNVGKNNGNWNPNRDSYYIVHHWVNETLGKPNKCEDCNTTNAKRYEWANISKQYLKDISDWKRLCRSCHTIFDMNENWRDNLSLAAKKRSRNKLGEFI